jgi:molybdopterin biosynthesis enzyme
VEVFQLPKVAVLSTGDEVMPLLLDLWTRQHSILAGRFLSKIFTL